jgi:lysophospholipase L1-like esterase
VVAGTSIRTRQTNRWAKQIVVSILARPSDSRGAAEALSQTAGAVSTRNWVFLGDSLTEGVGSKRVSHVTELVKQLRTSGCAAARDANVHEFRLRHMDTFTRGVEFNVAGLLNRDLPRRASDVWLWNLACEGQTIETDFDWLPLIAALRPEVVVIFRGSLESIIRPAMLLDGDWPWWVPHSWRGYAAMDPRCYFSPTWWRRAKQVTVDSLKQKVRLKLLRQRAGSPLMALDRLAVFQADLIRSLRAIGTRVVMLGLLPVDHTCFPGSAEYFETVNARLLEIATVEGAEFFDWASSLAARGKHEDLFYRDGFHPNEAGTLALAEILRERFCAERSL